MQPPISYEHPSYQQYLSALRAELVPAMGCTEPIAIAYTAAVARDTLGTFPDAMHVMCSGNIIKNAKGVIIPNSTGMRGIRAAAILGALAGDISLGMEVLRTVAPEDIAYAKTLLKSDFCTEGQLQDRPDSVTSDPLHILVEACSNNNTVTVEVLHQHTNVVRITRNREDIFRAKELQSEKTLSGMHRPAFTLEGILDFVENGPVEEISDLLDLEIKYNSAIAEAGLKGEYGIETGKSLLQEYGYSIDNLSAAYAAAGSDARMSGCMLPVIINSGSGNQGLTVSLPVIRYAEYLNCSHIQLYRALALSNLVAIQQKSMMERLSAYCGAVCAACGAGAAITWLRGGSRAQIEASIVNTIGTVAGMICDGAKPSCSLKIAAAVKAAMLGQRLALHDHACGAGEGIVKDTAEKTMEAAAQLATEGMRETDQEILRIMMA